MNAHESICRDLPTMWRCYLRHAQLPALRELKTDGLGNLKRVMKRSGTPTSSFAGRIRETC